MKIVFISILCLLFCITISFGLTTTNFCYANDLETGKNETGYPHGSPFPPGKEPSLTHTVDVFWTTMGDIDRTDIEINSPGGRPTQVEGRVPKLKDGKFSKGNPVYATIAPDCRYHFVFVRKENKTLYETGKVFRHNGMGTITVRIYGYKSKDYNMRPRIVARYYKGKTLLGTTSFRVHPVSEKIKKLEKKNK